MVNEMVVVDKYDIVATAMCDVGIVTVLNNNSDTYLVGIRHFYGDNSVISPQMRVLKLFTYGEKICPAFRAACDYMVVIAIRNTDDNSESDAPAR